MKSARYESDDVAPLDNAQKVCSTVQQALHQRRLFSIDWRTSFLYLGRQFIKLNAQTDQLPALLKQKSDAYGDSPIESWGELGVIIRIDSKLQRYRNLTANPELNTNDESAADTLNDLLGYAILGYRLVTRKLEHHNPEELKRVEMADATNLSLIRKEHQL